MKEKILAYWNSISQREQRGAIAVGIVVLISVFYLGLINPLLSRATEAEQALDKEKKLATWVGDKVSQIKSLQVEGDNLGSSSSMSISQAVTSSVANFDLQIVRLQPQQEDLQVWLQPAAFNNLLLWLDELEKRYAIVVKFIEVDKGDASGMVEVKRLQLGRI